MERYPAYAYAYSIDMTDIFYNEIKDRLTHNKNIIIEIVGEPGSGKSYSGSTIALFCNSVMNVPFTIKNFAWTNTDFIESVSTFQKRNTIVKDEQPRAIYGEGSVIEQVTMQDIEEIIRKAQINMVFISPESRSWHSGVHYILQTFDMSYTNRTNTLLVHPSTDHNLTEPIGAIILKHPVDAYPSFKPVLDQYEALKDEFISDATNQTSRAKFFMNLQKKARILANDKNYALQPKKNRKAYLYLKHPALSSQLSQSLVDTLLSMTEIMLSENDDTGNTKGPNKQTIR